VAQLYDFEKHNLILISNEIDTPYPSFKLHVPLMFSIDLQNLISVFSSLLLMNLGTAGLRYQHDCISNIAFLIWMFVFYGWLQYLGTLVMAASQAIVNVAEQSNNR
jgi:hypothetical protein